MKINKQDKLDIIFSYETGVPVEEMAKIYGVTGEAIRLIVRHLGKPHHKHIQDIENEFLERAKKKIKQETESAFISKLLVLTDSGISHSQLIQLYGDKAKYITNKHKLETFKNNKRDGTAVQMVFKGKTYNCKTVAEAAKISGYSQSHISNALSGRYTLKNATIRYAD